MIDVAGIEPEPNEPVYYASDDVWVFDRPELSDWQCELLGMGPMGIVFRPRKGCEPNWFWRWMQFLAFGNRWVKDRK